MNAEGAHVEVFDCTGALVRTFTGKQQQVLDCSAWARGVYFVKITFGSGARETRKVLIQ
jgi:hypothetical protein